MHIVTYDTSCCFTSSLHWHRCFVRRINILLKLFFSWRLSVYISQRIDTDSNGVRLIVREDQNYWTSVGLTVQASACDICRPIEFWDYQEANKFNYEGSSVVIIRMIFCQVGDIHWYCYIWRPSHRITSIHQKYDVELCHQPAKT